MRSGETKRGSTTEDHAQAPHKWAKRWLWATVYELSDLT